MGSRPSSRAWTRAGRSAGSSIVRAPGAWTHEREHAVQDAITHATATAEHDITHATTEIPRAIETAVTTETSRAVKTDAALAPSAEARAPRPVSYVSVPPAVWALARGIAAVLGETLPPPIRTITRVVDRLGPDRAHALLGQALTSEASGGVLLPDGRRRTPGGTFLFLVRTAADLSPDDRAFIFPKAGYHARGVGHATPASATPTPAAPPHWSGRTTPTARSRRSFSTTIEGRQPP